MELRRPTHASGGKEQSHVGGNLHVAARKRGADQGWPAPERHPVCPDYAAAAFVTGPVERPHTALLVVQPPPAMPRLPRKVWRVAMPDPLQAALLLLAL